MQTQRCLVFLREVLKLTPSWCHLKPLPDFAGRTFGTNLLVEIARQAEKNSAVAEEKSLWKLDLPQSPPLRKRRCGALSADAQRVMGLHVHVLAPLSWLCPEGRPGEPVGKLGARAGMGPGVPLRIVFARQGQYGINGHQIMIKLCQDPKTEK